MQQLNRTQVWKIPFIPDRGITAALLADTTLLDFARIVIEKHTASGKIRMKVGSGEGLRFSEEGYVNDSIITRSDPTTKAWGDIPAGTTLTDKSIIEAVYDAYWQHQDVNLSGLSVSPNQLEIGFQLSGNLVVTPAIQNAGNLLAGTDAGLISSALVADQNFDPRSALTIAAIATTYNTPASVPITVTIYGTDSETSQRSEQFQWLPRIIHLVSTNPALTAEATILAAAGGGSVLSNSRARDYDFAGGGYNYIFIPSFISIANIGFTDIDLNTGNPLFNFAMQQLNNVIINNGQISVTLQCFRSVNQFSAPTRIRVS